MLPETGAKHVNEGHGISSYSEVIHMHHNDDALPGLRHDLMEDSLVNRALRETEVREDADKCLVPTPPRLLESLQRLLQAEHHAARAALVVARGVMHEQDFIAGELSIEVCCLDIELLKLHVELVSKCEDGVHRSEPCDGCVGIVIVHAVNITEALRDQAGLVVDNPPRGVLLCLEDPLGADDIRSRGWLFQVPGTCSF